MFECGHSNVSGCLQDYLDSHFISKPVMFHARKFPVFREFWASLQARLGIRKRKREFFPTKEMFTYDFCDTASLCRLRGFRIGVTPISSFLSICIS